MCENMRLRRITFANSIRTGWRIPGKYILANIAVIFALGITKLNYAAEIAATQTLQELVQQWVELQREMASADCAWESEKTLLLEEIKLLRHRKQKLKQSIAAVKAKQQVEEKRSTQLEDEKEQLTKHIGNLDHILARINERLLGILPLLPPAVNDKIADEIASLQKDARFKKTKAIDTSLENTLTVLRAIQRSDNQLHQGRVTLAPDGHQQIEMRVLYFGLARAFAVSPDNQFAAVGVPKERGWQWQWQNDIAPAVAKALSIMRDKQTADFVSLPFELPPTPSD